MLRSMVALFLFFSSFLVFSDFALAEKRVALVIGNAAYKHAPELANPRNDAKDMAAALTALGIEVIEGVDLDKQGLDRKIRDFASALSGAHAGIFFYAGHGLQVNGKNYIVPVDAELLTVSALDFEMVPIELVQRAMERETRTNILFLDACRNNPLSRNLARALGTRSTAIGRGLAVPESGIGTLISFSTAPGKVALDGTGRNSPYAASLVKAIATPGVDLLSVLTNVRNDVFTSTAERQLPWDNNALLSKFYFNPVASDAAKTATRPVKKDSSDQTGNAADEWKFVDKASALELETFLARHGSSPYAPYAKARLAALSGKKASLPGKSEAADGEDLKVPKVAKSETDAGKKRQLELERKEKEEADLKRLAELQKEWAKEREIREREEAKQKSIVEGAFEIKKGVVFLTPGYNGDRYDYSRGEEMGTLDQCRLGCLKSSGCRAFSWESNWMRCHFYSDPFGDTISSEYGSIGRRR